MTTYSHTLTLGEIEYPIVREALLLLLGKCRSEDDEAEQARAIVYEAIINDMLASLEESRDLSSTSSFCQDAPSTRIDPKPNNGATFSECGRYRYKLCRIWDDSLPQVTFIGLNPSTADASIDDQTVKRCTGLYQG